MGAVREATSASTMLASTTEPSCAPPKRKKGAGTATKWKRKKGAMHLASASAGAGLPACSGFASVHHLPLTETEAGMSARPQRWC